MDFFLDIFRAILFVPLVNALVFLYEYLPGKDLGVAIIVLTIFIRLVLYPLSAKAAKAQKIVSALQPKLKELKEKHKNDREGYARATMELYRKEGINPFAPLVPVLIQIPLLIAVYHVFLGGFESEKLSSLYSFVPNPGVIDPYFFGFINLSEPYFLFALTAGVLQFVQIKQTLPKYPKEKKNDGKPDFASTMQKQMLFVFPVVIVIFGSQLLSAIALYWIITSIFSIWQYWFINRDKKEGVFAEAKGAV